MENHSPLFLRCSNRVRPSGQPQGAEGAAFFAAFLVAFLAAFLAGAFLAGAFLATFLTAFFAAAFFLATSNSSIQETRVTVIAVGTPGYADRQDKSPSESIRLVNLDKSRVGNVCFCRVHL